MYSIEFEDDESDNGSVAKFLDLLGIEIGS